MRKSAWPKYCAAIGIALASIQAHPLAQSQGHGTGTTKAEAQPAANPKPIDLSPIQNEIHRIASATEAIKAKFLPNDDSGKRGADAAQQAAKWAFWMVIVAGGDTLITGFGVWLILQTLREARRSANEASRQADEAKRQADFAENALIQTKATAENDLRAWLDVEVSLIECKTGQNGNALVDIEVRLVNVGKTPALEVTTGREVWLSSTIVLNNGPPPVEERNPTSMPSLMPTKEASQRFGVYIKKTDFEKSIADYTVRRSGLMLVADVVAYYRTVFDAPDAEKHKTSIRYSIHPANYHSPLQDDGSRTWIRTIRGKNEVRFAHDKSAPVYMT